MRTLLGLISILSLITALPVVPEVNNADSLTNLDNGLQWQFVRVTLSSGEEYRGQVIGVYNEAKFMWHPTPHSTLAIFTCSDFSVDLGSFSVEAGRDPAVFTVSTSVISTVTLMEQPSDLVEYQEYMRLHGHVFENTPVQGEIWISRGWDSYHHWEDGRGNYAWDMGALNANMMSYSGYGTRNTDFTVWGMNVQLPMGGKVVTAVEKEIDNQPDMNAAVDLGDNENGEGVDLEEKPHNLVEVQVGGDTSPFLLRLIHLKQNSIPNNIQVGSYQAAGTVVGTVGNSGTTLVPHLHSVWGFYDSDNRYWSLPIQWKDAAHRILLAYPAGYQYGQYHHHDYFYPKYGNCVTN